MNSMIHEALRVIKKFPVGSEERLGLIKTVQVTKIRYRRTLDTLRVFTQPQIPYLKDKYIRQILHRECDLDREKSIAFIESQLVELDKVEEELNK